MTSVQRSTSLLLLPLLLQLLLLSKLSLFCPLCTTKSHPASHLPSNIKLSVEKQKEKIFLMIVMLMMTINKQARNRLKTNEKLESYGVQDISENRNAVVNLEPV